MYWHILLTEKCNSECKYCYEKSMKEFDNGLDKKFKFDFTEPCSSEINLDKLKKFLSQDKTPVVVFYGGEPLLNISKLKEIMDKLGDSVGYCMQTNGKLLNELASEYMNNFSRILVSIDGNRERTDFNRGKGTYDKVIKNIKLIREKGFKGEIVARMTISQEFPDLFEQVKNVLDLNLFDSVHWQLDAGFYKNDFDEEKIKNFFKNYNLSVNKLVNFCVEEIKKGRVLKVYPFFGIANRLLGKDKETRIQCGAGYAGYAVTTNGKIAGCPILNNIKDFYCGNLDSKKLKEIKIEECDGCEVREICGGRCLYWRKAKLWPEKGDKMICDSIKFLIKELKKNLPSLESVDLEYEKYFGPEIIP